MWVFSWWVFMWAFKMYLFTNVLEQTSQSVDFKSNFESSLASVWCSFSRFGCFGNAQFACDFVVSDLILNVCLWFSSRKDLRGVSSQSFCTVTIVSLGCTEIHDLLYFLHDLESTTCSTFWGSGIFCTWGGTIMWRSDAKRCSSLLKACPLTKEVIKEVRREEEGQEGMEMDGELPPWESTKCYSCKECGKNLCWQAI